MKMIDLLNLIANDTLEDETRVIIENELYKYDRENKKIRIANDKDKFRIIHTEKLNTEVEVLFNLKKHKKERTNNDKDERRILYYARRWNR